MVTPDGTITTIAGNGTNGCAVCTQGEGGPATSFALTDPVGLALDARANLLISDWINDRVYTVSPAGIITTLAGASHAPTLAGGLSGDGGPATGAELDGPAAVAVDGHGNVSSQTASTTVSASSPPTARSARTRATGRTRSGRARPRPPGPSAVPKAWLSTGRGAFTSPRRRSAAC